MNGQARYYLDLSAISLRDLYATFVEGNIAPGRKILFQSKDERRTALESHGVENVAALIDAVKSKTRFAAVAEATGLDPEYLTILARQARSYRPSPVALDRFDEADEATREALSRDGIRNSKHLYDAVHTAGSVDALAARIGVSSAHLEEYVALSEVVRVPGVGPVFARFLYRLGVRSVTDLAVSDPGDLFTRIEDHLETVGYGGPRATEWDLAFCVDFARRLETANRGF